MALLIAWVLLSLIFFASLAIIASKPPPPMEADAYDQVVDVEKEHEEAHAFHSF